MDFDGGAAVGAGLIGGAVMGMLLYMGIWMMPRQMKMNLFLMLGTMMFRDRTMAIVAGGMMHAVMSIVFGLIHVAFFVAFDLETELVAWGILFGVVHWMISGMGLGMMPMMHPLIRRGEMDSPGAFALSYPPMTAMGFFMLHIVFGIVVGALYTAFT
ncbi:MAG: hypothetical protein IH862_03100 [Chloroflexi bacterium]|nr:hypothetical protein [Chloroflexota bacterium]